MLTSVNNMSDTDRDDDSSADIDLSKRMKILENWVEGKINQTNSAPEVKRSVLNHFHWLNSKCRMCEDYSMAEMLNHELSNLLDYVDSMPPFHPESVITSHNPDLTAKMMVAIDSKEAMDRIEEPNVRHSQWEEGGSERALALGHERSAEQRCDRNNRRNQNYGNDALLNLQPDDKADVVLNVPNVSVDLIDFEVNNINARVALDAGVGQDMVKLLVGVDVKVERMKLQIENVQATAQLIVRLDNVRNIVEKGLEVVDSVTHPSLLGMAQHLLRL